MEGISNWYTKFEQLKIYVMKKVLFLFVALVAIAVSVSANRKAPPVTSSNEVSVFVPVCQSMYAMAMVSSNTTLVSTQTTSNFMMQNGRSNQQMLGFTNQKTNTIMEVSCSQENVVCVNQILPIGNSYEAAGNSSNKVAQNIQSGLSQNNTGEITTLQT